MWYREKKTVRRRKETSCTYRTWKVHSGFCTYCTQTCYKQCYFPYVGSNPIRKRTCLKWWRNLAKTKGQACVGICKVMWLPKFLGWIDNQIFLAMGLHYKAVILVGLGLCRASDISRKKRKISRDFQGQIRGKIGRFRRIFAGTNSKFTEKSADFWYFCRKKVKISRKIGRFRGIFAEKSQILKDFQRQILRKIGRFHGKFWGETSPRNNQ